MIASNLSNNPPWPGSRFPESFKLTRRLRYDSNKSPDSAKNEIKIDKIKIRM